MIHDDFIRQLMLIATGMVFVSFALWATFSSKSLANLLGYTLSIPNGQSEFHAIYVGVFSAQAALCGLAAIRVSDPVLGDLVAFFLLAQPLGRLIALPRFGAPQGMMRWLFVLELAAGGALLLIRPVV